MDRIIARMKKASGRRGGDKTPLRKLERRDALKNVNYDAASCSSSSSADDLSVSTSSLMTRSLEFPDRTSFRIYGRGEGEIDRICKSVGVSGPDDFAISFDAWEASKMRSSSEVINRFNSLDRDIHKSLNQDLSEAGGDANSELTRSESSLIGSFMNLADRDAVEERNPGLVPNSLDHEVHKSIQDLSEAGPSGGDSELTRSEIGSFRGLADRVVVVEKKPGLERAPTIREMSRGYLLPSSSGIKGVRPPVLKPPPAQQPSTDHEGSSWDFPTHLAPEDEVVRRASSSKKVEEALEEDVETETRILESADTADEACSFTTNEGGDSSSTVSNTSPPICSSGSVITSWLKGELLGRGSFGSVYEGISSSEGGFFAVKEVSLLEQGSQAQECIQQLEREIALLSQLQHQNIVRYRGTSKDGSNLYIFLELVTQGSLQKLYQRYQLPDSVVSTYTRQILDGLKYLHGEGFIHRDIKCANILVDASGAVKLADFGLAKVSKLNDIKSSHGTPYWMAPEVINLKRTDGYGSSADIWSLGCTVLEMLTRQIPYSDLEDFQALFRIGRGILPDIPDTLSLDARDFIIKCLKVDPEERPTAAELLNHPFVKKPLASSGSGIRISTSP